MEILLIFLGMAAPLIMVVGTIIKFYQISRFPVNVRWEIYPLPLESGERRKYGGSYLEEVDWVKKKHEKSIIAEFTEPLREIFYLHRVKEFNPYGIWLWSMFLHWGIWLLFLWILLIVVAAISESFNLSNFSFIAYLAYILGVIGSAGLIIKRLSNKDLKLYTSGIDYLNLLFLFILFGTGLLMMNVEDPVYESLSYVGGILRFDLSIFEISTMTVVHFLLFKLFLIYIPFSRFFHGPVKFFTFHKILWNDEFQKKDSSQERKISQQLNYKVRWAGPHILPEQSWLENAKNTNLHEK